LTKTELFKTTQEVIAQAQVILKATKEDITTVHKIIKADIIDRVVTSKKEITRVADLITDVHKDRKAVLEADLIIDVHKDQINQNLC